jgi:HEAT repeat protein
MLGSQGEHPEWRDEILKSRTDLLALLDHEDTRLRATALAALASLKDREAVEGILPLLGDPTERIRRTAAISLGKIGDVRAVPALAPLLADPLFTVRDPVARALAGMGAEGLAALREALAHEDFKVRGLAAEALGRVSDPGVVPDLIPLLRDPSGPVRAYAAEVLGKLGSPESMAPLREALGKETETFPRSEMEKAIEALETRE